MKWVLYIGGGLLGVLLLAVVILMGLGLRSDAGRMQASVVVRRSPVDVWPWLTESGKLKAWVGWLIEVREESPGAHGIGSRSVWVMEDRNNNNQKLEIVNEVCEWVPARRLATHAGFQNMFSTDAAYVLTDLGDGGTRIESDTRVHYGHPLAKVFEPLITWQAGKKTVEDLGRWKSLAER
ncbi:SRPBCC family protein [Paludibaculum fermentans]|uniref:SRPBCC family protein n=1 Tax=Paludibaculum fermentans TaxID=1473598 RepID=UPI003EBEC608